MVIENKYKVEKVISKVEGWAITVVGGLVATVGGFFFKNFYSRIDKVEKNVTKLETKLGSFKETLKDQKEQNTREHDQLSKNIEILRDSQREVFKDIKDILRNNYGK